MRVTMRITRSVALLVTGIAAGVVLIVSCSDDSPGHADAAACECPAAEPPLAGRIQRVTDTVTVAANGDAGVTAGCPDGASIIGGGCATSPEGSIYDVVLQYSHQSDSGRVWECRFHNNMPMVINIRASAYCLVPAP
jgi:hypothetical protein